MFTRSYTALNSLLSAHIGGKNEYGRVEASTIEKLKSKKRAEEETINAAPIIAVNFSNLKAFHAWSMEANEMSRGHHLCELRSERRTRRTGWLRGLSGKLCKTWAALAKRSSNMGKGAPKADRTYIHALPKPRMSHCSMNFWKSVQISFSNDFLQSPKKLVWNIPPKKHV